MNDQDTTSTRPYLIRALYEWCTDNGLTPYLAVRVDESVQVPREYVKDGEIVLNISYDATSALQLGNDYIEFKARFGGQPREIMVPVGRVIAIYARENGQGMAFPPPVDVHTLPMPTLVSRPEVVGREDRVVQLTSVADSPTESSTHSTMGEGGDDKPPPPNPPTAGAGSGARAALKRVK